MSSTGIRVVRGNLFLNVSVRVDLSYSKTRPRRSWSVRIKPPTGKYPICRDQRPAAIVYDTHTCTTANKDLCHHQQGNTYQVHVA